MRIGLIVAAVAACLLAACDNKPAAPAAPAIPQGVVPGEPLPLDALEGHVVALGEGPGWRLDADGQMGISLKLEDQGLMLNANYAAPTRVSDHSARITSAPLTLTLEAQECKIGDVTYPMRANVTVQDGAPLTGCAFVRWDRHLTELLPAIDSCLSVATEPMWVSYAAPDADRVLVRLTLEGEGFDCRVGLDPAAGPAVITPADPALQIGGDGDVLFVRAPGDNPGGECYEAPEVRAADGSLLGWLADPEGC